MATTATITINSVEGNDAIKVIHVAGELDETNLPEFEGTLTPLIEDQKIKVFIFDFVELRFMNSKVIGFFAYVYTTLSRNQRRIIFASYNQTIYDILTLVGLDKLVDSEVTLEGAIQAAYKMLNPAF
jgi:anti-anti-sigma factor